MFDPNKLISGFTKISKDNIFTDFKSDYVAGIKAYSQCISLSDVMFDGENRLVIADINSKLKVFNGLLLQSEANLNFTPVCLLAFYTYDQITKTSILNLID